MTYKEMKALALFLNCSDDSRCRHKDLFYDTLKKIFLSRIATSTSRVAITWDRGKTYQGWITKSCVHVGRYNVDVNPDWIIEDLKNV